MWFERHGNRLVAELNGQPIGAEFDWRSRIFPLTRFSDDGRHLAVEGIRAKKGAIIFDGRDVSAGFDEVSGVALSADSRHRAHGIVNDSERESGSFVVVDGVEGKVYAWV